MGRDHATGTDAQLPGHITEAVKAGAGGQSVQGLLHGIQIGLVELVGGVAGKILIQEVIQRQIGGDVDFVKVLTSLVHFLY